MLPSRGGRVAHARQAPPDPLPAPQAAAPAGGGRPWWRRVQGWRAPPAFSAVVVPEPASPLLPPPELFAGPSDGAEAADRWGQEPKRLDEGDGDNDQWPGQSPECAPVAPSALHATQEPAPEGQVPKSHTVLRELGSGTSGRVFLVEDRDTGRLAALKAQGRRGSQAQRAREVANEAATLRKLSHQSVVQLLDVKQTPERLELLMEYAGPESLAHAIDSAACSRLPETRSRRLFAQLAAGVEHCHSRDVVHRDLKPLNVVLSPDGQSAKLVDFGSASTLAVRCKHVGTVAFMAPEVLALRQAPFFNAAKADVWSLGVLLLEMVCGLGCLPETLRWRLPCDPGPGLAADLQRLLADETSLGRVLEQCALRPPAGSELRDLLGRMLRLNVRQRWAASDVVIAAWLVQGD